MRLLLPAPSNAQAAELRDSDLRELYAFDLVDRKPLVRASMVQTVDGAIAGADGRSGSINTDADHAIFTLQRDLADVIVVGAGTARAEGYGRGDTPIVVVSRSGELPPSLRCGDGMVIVATCASSGGSATETTWLLGRDEVDLCELVTRLSESGMPRVLVEGGPRLLRDLCAQGLIDQLALSTAPWLAGPGPTLLGEKRIGQAHDLELVHLLEENSTLMTLWRLRPS